MCLSFLAHDNKGREKESIMTMVVNTRVKIPMFNGTRLTEWLEIENPTPSKYPCQHCKYRRYESDGPKRVPIGGKLECPYPRGTAKSWIWHVKHGLRPEAVFHPERTLHSFGTVVCRSCSQPMLKYQSLPPKKKSRRKKYRSHNAW